jgi:predicted  nucleic acid-binding Zn-ribbon protein
MNDEKFNAEKFPIVEKLFSELTCMQHDLIEGGKLKAEYERELSYRKQIEEEAHKVKTSLEEELVKSRSELQRITDELLHESGERKRIEEESNKIKSSLEEELARSRAEIQKLTEELQSCITTMDKLQQSINQINSITKSVQTVAGIDGDNAP